MVEVAQGMPGWNTLEPGSLPVQPSKETRQTETHPVLSQQGACLSTCGREREESPSNENVRELIKVIYEKMNIPETL